jgi:hypothetical protein
VPSLRLVAGTRHARPGCSRGGGRGGDGEGCGEGASPCGGCAAPGCPPPVLLAARWCIGSAPRQNRAPTRATAGGLAVKRRCWRVWTPGRPWTPQATWRGQPRLPTPCRAIVSTLLRCRALATRTGHRSTPTPGAENGAETRQSNAVVAGRRRGLFRRVCRAGDGRVWQHQSSIASAVTYRDRYFQPKYRRASSDT